MRTIYRVAGDAVTKSGVRARRMSAMVNPISSITYGLIEGRTERRIVPLARRGDAWYTTGSYG